MKEILNYLSATYWKLTDEAMQYVLQKTDELSIRKSEILLKEGEVCKYVWFVKSGLLRALQRDPRGGKKIYSNWFMGPKDIATSVISFFGEQKSEEGIDVLEGGVVFRMSRKDLFEGIQKYPCLALVTLMIVIKYYSDTRVNETYLRMKRPEYIHKYLRERQSELLSWVPEGMMAMYLGVSNPKYRDIKSGKVWEEKEKKSKSKAAKTKKNKK
jgi:CRP-like cAMP-binding protein